MAVEIKSPRPMFANAARNLFQSMLAKSRSTSDVSASRVSKQTLDALDLSGIDEFREKQRVANKAAFINSIVKPDPDVARRSFTSPKELPDRLAALDLFSYDHDGEDALRVLNQLTQHATGNIEVLRQARAKYEEMIAAHLCSPGVRLEASLRNHLLKGYLDGLQMFAKRGYNDAALYQKTNLPTDPEHASAGIFREFDALNWSPMQTYFKKCRNALEMFNAHMDEQRYFVNFGTDDHLVNRKGVVGPTRAADFVNLVETGDGPKLATLQGQGPKTGQRTSYAFAAANYAKRHQCARVYFLNCAIDRGQVPSFEQAVQKVAQRAGVTMSYDQVERWEDSSLPSDATPIINAVDRVVDWVHSQTSRALVVYNCHAGMDRSGIVNALVQLRVHAASQDPDKFEFNVIKNIRDGRPFAFASIRRVDYVMQLDRFMRHRDKSAAAPAKSEISSVG